MNGKMFKNIKNSHKHIESFDVHKEYDLNYTFFQRILKSDDVDIWIKYINAFQDCDSLENIIDIDSSNLIFLGIYKDDYAEGIKHNSVVINNTYIDEPFIIENKTSKSHVEFTRWGRIYNDELIIGIIDYLYGNIILDTSSTITNIKFKNTYSIYTREYLCEIKKMDFDNSTNSTLYDSDKKYIMDEQLYITSVGLYDDNYELLAVGKFTKPLKKPDVDLGIIIKFDL